MGGVSNVNSVIKTGGVSSGVWRHWQGRGQRRKHKKNRRWPHVAVSALATYVGGVVNLGSTLEKMRCGRQCGAALS